jgi:hypothetical protein
MRADVVGQRQPRHGELDEVTELKGWGRSRPQADRLAGHIIRPWARDSLRGGHGDGLGARDSGLA